MRIETDRRMQRTSGGISYAGQGTCIRALERRMETTRGIKRMRSIVKIVAVLGIACALLFGCASCGPADDQSLKESDRIIFLGDSITQAGVQPYGYVTLTSQAIDAAYPDLGIEVIGAGVSGHRVPDCQYRLDRDVLQKDPSIVVIVIGINDVWQWDRDDGTTKEDFEAGLKDMITRINADGARVILCTPTVIGEKTDGTNEFDQMLDEYSDISRRVAEETDTQLLDLREAFMAYLKEHNPENAAKGILTRDEVHLNAAGNILLSDLVLDALGVPNVEE